jgi:hypothetical protein
MTNPFYFLTPRKRSALPRSSPQCRAPSAAARQLQTRPLQGMAWLSLCTLHPPPAAWQPNAMLLIGVDDCREATQPI